MDCVTRILFGIGVQLSTHMYTVEAENKLQK
jgi:hypothetical protein